MFKIRNTFSPISCTMLQTKTHILPLIKFFAILVFFFISTPATAHVEKGTMPDPVAEMEYRILLELEPDNLEVRIRLGLVLYRSGKFDETASEFDHVLKKDPENIEALIGLARVNIKLLNYPQAITLLKEALPIGPDDMHIYYYLGQALEMQGDLSGAEEIYNSGLSREISSQNEHSAEERQVVVEALKKLQGNKEKTLGQN